jgi:DNA-binding HxlR family transcriptional regulator
MDAGLLVGWVASDEVGDVYNNACPGQMIVEHIASRWAPLILTALRDGPMRFFELRDKIGGISEKVLSQKLKTLVRDGLLERTVEPATPPQVTYSLTGLGTGISQPLQHLIEWIATNGSKILLAQQDHDANRR